jgi:hypothetical protein
MQLSKSSFRRLRSVYVPGLLGGLFALVLTNLWFYYFAWSLIPGSLPGSLMPDVLAYLAIDVFVGLGCGYAGGLTGPALLSLFDSQGWLPSLIPTLYSFVIGVTVALIVNTVLFLMFAI